MAKATDSDPAVKKIQQEKDAKKIQPGPRPRENTRGSHR